MNPKLSRIGLALSGGGIRAAIFHLGVLQYLAEANLFSRIANISSVSGASLAMGVIFAVNDNRWPRQSEFLHTTQPRVREIILQNNIQSAAIKRLPFSPWYWHNRVGLLARMLEEKWGVRGTLQDLPHFPYWEINCTTFETGRNFRLRRDYMGDPAIGYVQNPRLPISHMIAASAAFPVLIGPYVLKTKGMHWTRDKQGVTPGIEVDDRYTLWDGGVYDNLGLDALYKIGRGLERELDEEIDFLIVSNAGAPIQKQARRGHLSIANLRRLLDIATNQVGALRSQQVYASVISQNHGMYLKIGLKYPTTLNSPTTEDFEAIFRHGFESAKHAYKSYIADSSTTRVKS